jgi:hypothetical protein
LSFGIFAGGMTPRQGFRLSGVISCTRLNGGNSGFGELLHRKYRFQYNKGRA